MVGGGGGGGGGFRVRQTEFLLRDDGCLRTRIVLGVVVFPLVVFEDKIAASIDLAA